MTVRSLEKQAVEWLSGANNEELDALIFDHELEFDAELRGDIVKAVMYCFLREGGAEPAWAMKSACGRAARMVNSDGSFNEHARHRMSAFADSIGGKDYLKIAKKAGVTTQGKYFVSALGSPDSQDSWVSTTDDVEAVCRKKNLNTLEGSHVKVNTGIRDPKKVGLNPKIIDRIAKDQIAGDPALASKVKQGGDRAMKALKNKIREKHTRKKQSP